MPTPIIIPRLGWSMEEGAFVAWLKANGQWVNAGDLLFSIEGDKAVQEIESMDAGVLRIASNGPKPQDPVRVGDVIGHLLSKAEVEAGETTSPSPSPGIRLAPNPPAASTADPAADPAVLAKTPEPRHEPVVPERLQAPSRPASHGADSSSTAPESVAAPKITPRALRTAKRLQVDWKDVRGSGAAGRIRERDIVAVAKSPRPPRTADIETVLVTGGCGFIGTWVIRDLLDAGLRVVVLDHADRPDRWRRVLGPREREVVLGHVDLLDRRAIAATLREHDVTRIIHLAALLTPACQTDPWEGCRVNVMGTVALFEAVRGVGGRIRGVSYASSVAVYGDEPDHSIGADLPATRGPRTFYGVFKRAVEELASQYWSHFGIASVGIRPQVAYGPERESGLTAGPSLAAKAVARGESYCIPYTGRVGYDYVEDVARAFVRAASETPPGACVVDLPGPVADVAEVIAALAEFEPSAASRIRQEGPPIPAVTPARPHLISQLYPDWTITPLSVGMRRTHDYYRTEPR